MKKKPMTDRTYKLHEGQRCPACRERTVEIRGNVELDGPGGVAPAGCTSCGATWYECYELSGYCGLEVDMVDFLDHCENRLYDEPEAYARLKKMRSALKEFGKDGMYVDLEN